MINLQHYIYNLNAIRLFITWCTLYKTYHWVNIYLAVYAHATSNSVPIHVHRQAQSVYSGVIYTRISMPVTVTLWNEWRKYRLLDLITKIHEIWYYNRTKYIRKYITLTKYFIYIVSIIGNNKVPTYKWFSFFI